MEQLTGMPAASQEEIIAAARRVQALGPRQVVVSLGKEGAMAVSESDVWSVAAPHIDEQNPIGAGDSLVGGLGARLGHMVNDRFSARLSMLPSNGSVPSNFAKTQQF